MAIQTLKILTFNAGLRKVELFDKTLSEPVPYVEERTRALIAALERIDADVILLQEVYGRRRRARLTLDLQETYPGSLYRIDGRDGLMAYAKEMISGGTFRFKCKSWTEHMGVTRGALILKLDLIGVGRIALANAHTTTGAFWHPDSWIMQSVRIEQLRELIQVLDTEEGIARILAGTLGAEPEIQNMGYADPCYAAYYEPSTTVDPKNPLVCARKTPRPRQAQKSDHVLVSSTGRCAPIHMQSQVVLTESIVPANGALVPLSDHYGVLTELIWTFDETRTVF